MQAKSAGESKEQRWESFIRDWAALQEGPFPRMWTSATIDEILSALHERMVVGSLG